MKTGSRNNNLTIKPKSDDTIIWDLWLSSYRMPVVAVADEVGIFSTLAKQPATLEQASKLLNMEMRAVKVMFAMLTSLGLLELQEGRFQLSETSHIYLLPDSPYYWGEFIHLVRKSLPYYDQLLSVVKSMDSTHPGNDDDIYRDRPIDSWESGQIDIESAKRIAAFMHCHSISAATGLSHIIDLDGVKRLLDVGGGSGCFSIGFVQQYPELSCTVMELPAMCEVANDYIGSADVADRVDTCPVDMFRESWPVGYDAIFFSNIFHDWSSQTCEQLANLAFESLIHGGRIYLHEMLLDDSEVGPLNATTFSVSMLIGTRGRQYSFNELGEILGTAGFTDISVIPAYGYYSLVSGIKN